MLVKYIVEIFELLDSPQASGEKMREYLISLGAQEDWIENYEVEGKQGSTDFIRVTVPGLTGKKNGGDSPTLGVIGRLGGIGARPEALGFVSDGDGALACLAAAAKSIVMYRNGDLFLGDLIFSTHICPNSPTEPHEPVAFMSSPVDMETMNQYEISSDMDAIISVDTTKGNRIINKQGIAISPTVKEGYILRISEGLLDVMEIVTGRLPSVFAISDQDITPYGNDLYHINSILQPSTATSAPVVGLAIATETMVPGCATGATHLLDVDEASRFVLEVAKRCQRERDFFYSQREFELLVKKYGSKNILQTKGEKR